MGTFVTIEGIEGAGKSTLRTKLREALQRKVTELVVTREPGATHLGHALRNLLLDDSHKNEINPIAELMLFFADRAQHVSEMIEPALARDALVICDRYTHSTLAYQGYGRELPLDILKQLTEFTTGGLEPDVVLLLDIPPEKGLERAYRRTRKASSSFNLEDLEPGNEESWNRFEQQKFEFHKRVRNGFLELAKDPGNKIAVIDADRDPDEVFADALSEINKVL